MCDCKEFLNFVFSPSELVFFGLSSTSSEPTQQMRITNKITTMVAFKVTICCFFFDFRIKHRYRGTRLNMGTFKERSISAQKTN